MPGLSYPYHFQCRDCGEQTVIKRSEACDLHSEPDSFNAIDAVLKHRGWVQAFNGIYCPDCAGEA